MKDRRKDFEIAFDCVSADLAELPWDWPWSWGRAGRRLDAFLNPAESPLLDLMRAVPGQREMDV